MLETTNQSDDQNTQQGGSLQDPRNDVQQGTASQQLSESAVPQSTPATQQTELNNETLRVGDSATTVQNTTSTPPNYYLEHNLLNAAWLWLLIPIALAIVLFWPQKKRTLSGVSAEPSAEKTPVDSANDALPEGESQVSSTPKKTKKKSKKKASKSKK